MDFICQPSTLRGDAAIPGSKSHTIRAVMIATLAHGESVIEAPLVSADALSALAAAEALGAKVHKRGDGWRILGTGGVFTPQVSCIDVGNSGTTMNILLGLAALGTGPALTLTGDAQIQRRPSEPLASALRQLGAHVVSEKQNGCPPFRVSGPLLGGKAIFAAPSSQYLTSLLVACPLARGDSTLELTDLKEQPYVEMTLDWLRAQGIRFEASENLRRFRIAGGQCYRPFHRRVPADFSSASFFLCAGALGGNDVTCTGLDLADSQGDKAVVDYLRRMGAEIAVNGGQIRVQARPLQGVELDLDATPDALPVMAVTACFAQGRTVLHNVAHARIKETDRIAVMAGELRKLGAVIEERPDGLIIEGGAPLRGGVTVEGHHDHRVVMALALAGLCLPEGVRVTDAKAAGVTFPEFAALMRGLGGRIDEAVPTKA